jgi:hypothetical protein
MFQTKFIELNKLCIYVKYIFLCHEINKCIMEFDISECFTLSLGAKIKLSWQSLVQNPCNNCYPNSFIGIEDEMCKYIQAGFPFCIWCEHHIKSSHG